MGYWLLSLMFIGYGLLVIESLKFKVNSAFSALSARIIALRIENPYSILRQIANLPQRVNLPQLRLRHAARGY